MNMSGSLIRVSVLRTLVVLFVQTWMFTTIEAQNAPAVFFFGDSYCDTGNNDYINTGFKANFHPYGRDFIDHVPTGRFSNGKLMPDFFVEGLSIKDLLPAYLDPKLQDSDLITGVNFASSGSGLDNLTNNVLNAIPFWKQVIYFKEYTRRLVGLVGEERADIILNEAIYFIVIGSNDFINNYYRFSFRSSQLTVSQYTDFLLQIYLSYIKELYNLNAHRIGLINVPPLGCLPATKTLRNYSQITGECVNEVNQAVSGFNAGLNAIIDELKPVLPGLKIVSLDFYGLALELIANPGKWGIEVTDKACCVTGDIELVLICNRLTPFTCPDPDKYIFFDQAHFTQRTYDIISHTLLSREILQLL